MNKGVDNESYQADWDYCICISAWINDYWKRCCDILLHAMVLPELSILPLLWILSLLSSLLLGIWILVQAVGILLVLVREHGICKDDTAGTESTS